jgi:hypothetical protein
VADEPSFDVPVGLFEDVADLKAQVDQLNALVDQLTDHAQRRGEESAADDAVAGEETAPEDDDEGYPPFILLLDSPQYDEELRALTEWVEGVLVPGYLAEPSADARWCHLWFDHPVAVARLHACWLAWQELTDPATCGYTGPSVWHRDHLDPCLRELRASTGPFQGCTKGENQVNHRLPGLVPSAWRSPEGGT